MRNGEAETLWVREKALELVGASGLTLVAEARRPDDGWRAEFLGEVDGPPLVLLLHKPEAAPYISIECLVPGLGAAAVRDWPALLALVSEHELALWPEDRPQDGLHLSARLPVAALAEAPLRFWIGNLVDCRNRLIAEGEGECEA